MPETVTIVAFIRANLDEDEQVARLGPRTEVTASWSVEKFQPSEPGAVPVATWIVDDQQMGVGQVNGDFVAAHIARHDPARALREVAVKQALISLHKFRAVNSTFPPTKYDLPEDYTGVFTGHCELCSELGDREGLSMYYEPWPCPSLRIMASVYAEQPGYKEEWLP